MPSTRAYHPAMGLTIETFTTVPTTVAKKGPVYERLHVTVQESANGSGSMVVMNGIDARRSYGELIGMHDFLRGVRRVALIEDIEVAERARGRGIGTAILRELVEQARVHGATRLWLHASSMDHPDWQHSLEVFYTDRGFHYVGLDEVDEDDTEFATPLMGIVFG